MKTTTKLIGRTGAVLAFLFCLAAGLWILMSAIQERNKDDVLFVAMGLYFVGKAFFVGPMLWLSTERISGKRDWQ